MSIELILLRPLTLLLAARVRELECRERQAPLPLSAHLRQDIGLSVAEPLRHHPQPMGVAPPWPGEPIR
ncbi:hypothetical protein [Aeromonas simiae]|uniref:Uncharacterized protein n=1 Tax=Aeromonas simiae TaxID=218936 RepID=A0A5J6WZ11_9GAMM|nr:hypothetical protein [Aeromonas simiae]QFI55544.1 hypothetical protein FE240_13105 [Aeromonas simiae]